MVYALRPGPVHHQALHVDIETQGALTTGMAVGDLRKGGPNRKQAKVTVCCEADTDRILEVYEEVVGAGVDRLVAR
jgi:inosine-uridine nucleoside N-ribohydrolase